MSNKVFNISGKLVKAVDLSEKNNLEADQVILQNNISSLETSSATTHSVKLVKSDIEANINILETMCSALETKFNELNNTSVKKQSQVETVDATDLTTVITLLNELKEKINLMNS